MAEKSEYPNYYYSPEVYEIPLSVEARKRSGEAPPNIEKCHETANLTEKIFALANILEKHGLASYADPDQKNLLGIKIDGKTIAIYLRKIAAGKVELRLAEIGQLKNGKGQSTHNFNERYTFTAEGLLTQSYPMVIRHNAMLQAVLDAITSTDINDIRVYTKAYAQAIIAAHNREQRILSRRMDLTMRVQALKLTIEEHKTAINRASSIGLPN